MIDRSILEDVAALPLEELPEAIGLLAQAQAAATVRLVAPTPAGRGGHAAAPAPECEERFLTPEQAAEVAGLPLGTEQDRKRSLKRVYSWAHGRRWAVNPTGRFLRISGQPFRAWLRTRRP
jgi:hypothetical protein